MKSFLFFFLVFTCPFFYILSAKEKIYTDKIYKPHIKTVLLYANNNEQSTPVINLGRNDFLTLRFDDLRENTSNYSYRIIHCDPYWKASNLNEFYYIDGFEDNPIYDYEYSINTITPYIHYHLKIPNKDIRLKLSGNYILQVYDDYDKGNIVFEKRFFVIKKMATIQGQVLNSSKSTLISTHHDVEFQVSYNPEKIYNPLANIKIFITQNQRLDNTLREVEPQYIRNDKLIFSYRNEVEKTTFRAGYEFRFFNTTNPLLPSVNVFTSYKESGFEYIVLKPDKVRERKDIFYNNDINGKFIIGAKDRTDKHLESEYMWVMFTLRYDFEIADRKVFVAGSFNDWQYNAYNQMNYHPKLKAYTASILLKQGYYNYTYLTQDKEKMLDESLIDGSTYETENSYSVFMYYYNLEYDFYEFVGWKVLNSTFHT